jgi:hypothetical protein
MTRVLLAIHRDEKRSVSRISLATRALDRIWNSLEDATTRFQKLSKQTYAPGFSPEEGDVLDLRYELPIALDRCKKSVPQDVPVLSESKLEEWPLAAVVFLETGDDATYRFQAIDSRNMLAPDRNVVLFNPNGFELSSQTGIALSERVDAIYQKGHLAFTSELTVNRFLDISEHFREATDQEIDSLFSAKLFAPVDIEALKKIASSNVRRKFRAALQRKKLPTAKEILEIAKRIGAEIEILKGAVVVPTDAKQLTTFARILNDDFLETMDERKELYMSSSKRPVR